MLRAEVLEAELVAREAGQRRDLPHDAALEAVVVELAQLDDDLAAELAQRQRGRVGGEVGHEGLEDRVRRRARVAALELGRVVRALEREHLRRRPHARGGEHGRAARTRGSGSGLGAGCGRGVVRARPARARRTCSQ